MANNRLQIYCKKCLGAAGIAKYYPTQWYCNAPEQNPIHNFLVKHSESCWENDEHADHGGGENMFGFRTENDNDEYGTDYRNQETKLYRIESDKKIK